MFIGIKIEHNKSTRDNKQRNNNCIFYYQLKRVYPFPRLISVDDVHVAPKRIQIEHRKRYMLISYFKTLSTVKLFGTDNILTGRIDITFKNQLKGGECQIIYKYDNNLRNKFNVYQTMRIIINQLRFIQIKKGFATSICSFTIQVDAMNQQRKLQQFMHEKQLIKCTP